MRTNGDKAEIIVKEMTKEARSMAIFYMLGRFYLDFSDGDLKHLERIKETYK